MLFLSEVKQLQRRCSFITFRFLQTSSYCSYDRPFDHADSSLNLEEANAAAQRLTPAKFATAHIKASISSGNLVKILPHYPLDGQPATVEVDSIQHMLNNDDEYKELAEFPGPLIKGVTHKKTIIEYCENKIKNAAYSQEIVDTQSYILMWELLILLIRQNGVSQCTFCFIICGANHVLTFTDGCGS